MDKLSCHKIKWVKQEICNEDRTKDALNFIPLEINLQKKEKCIDLKGPSGKQLIGLHLVGGSGADKTKYTSLNHAKMKDIEVLFEILPALNKSLKAGMGNKFGNFVNDLKGWLEDYDAYKEHLNKQSQDLDAESQEKIEFPRDMEFSGTRIEFGN